jgi:uncharacterized Zn-binding protein involved in type VI secretion
VRKALRAAVSGGRLKSVFINGQPAVRAKDRTTCEGTVSDDVSPNVIIGGDTLTVAISKAVKRRVWRWG